VNRFLWKVVRGLYALDVGGVLPQEPPAGIRLVNPRRVPDELEQIPWFPSVRDTGPLGRYGMVFDYKWLGWKDGSLRGHAVAMLFWDRSLPRCFFIIRPAEAGTAMTGRLDTLAGPEPCGSITASIPC
jgi:hypothetical protein